MEIINLQCRQKRTPEKQQQRDKFRSCVYLCVCMCVCVCDIKCNARAFGLSQPCVSSCDQSAGLLRLTYPWHLHECICSHAAPVCACVLCTDACVSVREVTWSEQTKEREVELQIQLALNKKSTRGISFFLFFWHPSLVSVCFFLCVWVF